MRFFKIQLFKAYRNHVAINSIVAGSPAITLTILRSKRMPHKRKLGMDDYRYGCTFYLPAPVTLGVLWLMPMRA